MAAGDSLQPVLQGDPLKPHGVDATTLAEAIGHTFARPELAAEALTHRSALDRQPERKTAFPHGNERLEFLGDRVLSLAMAELLMRRFPDAREGELARRHNALVSATSLAETALSVGLGRHLVLGASERSAGAVKPAILSDALEALLGAVFLDGGFDAAASVVERLFGARLDAQRGAPRDAKTTLQEWAQARRLALPVYREIGRDGPAHAPFFVIEASVKGYEPSQGRAGSKREAEQLAAVALLARLDRE